MKNFLTLALVLAMCLCGCKDGSSDAAAGTTDTDGTVVITDCETPSESAPKGAKPTGSTVYDAHGNVFYRTVYEYDENGRIIKMINTDSKGEESGHAEREYNADGNEVKVLLYSKDKLVSREETEYDGTKKIEKITYDADGNVDSVVKYECDSNGNAVRETKYTPAGDVDCLFEVKYDENGKESERAQLSVDGSVVIRTVYEYTSDGEPLKLTQYYGNGSLYGCYEYEYDANGNMTKMTEYKGNGKVRNTVVYEY